MFSFRIVLLGTLLYTVAQHSNAFERDGFAWGMRIDDTIRILQESGFIAMKVPVKNPNNIIFFNRANTFHINGSLSFCDGRLAMYSPPYPLPPSQLTPPISSFLESLSELTKKYGPAQYRVSGSKVGGGLLRYQWRQEGEIVSLQLAVIGQGQHISISYVEPGSCLDKSQ